MASLPKGLASFENPPKSPARKPPASKLILHDRISMKSALPLLAVALSGCTSSVSHETVQQHITNQAHQIEAHAPAASRMIAVADFDDDGIADTAVVYTLESAHHDNSHQQFLAVSSSRLGGRFLMSSQEARMIGRLLGFVSPRAKWSLLYLNTGRRTHLVARAARRSQNTS